MAASTKVRALVGVLPEGTPLWKKADQRRSPTRRGPFPRPAVHVRGTRIPTDRGAGPLYGDAQARPLMWSSRRRRCPPGGCSYRCVVC